MRRTFRNDGYGQARRTASRNGWLGTAILAAALVAAPYAIAQTASRPRFANRAPDQPLTHRYTGGWEHFVGGGVAAFDCNGDYYPDLYLAGGEAPAKLLVNATNGPGARLVFRHLANRTTDLTGVTGAYPVDIDGDDALDLVVLRAGENVLLKGDGGCGFMRANEAWSLASEERWTTAFSATWEPGQSWPTLAFGNYVDRSRPDGPFEACDDNFLYRPTGAAYGPPLALKPAHCALSLLFSDWGRSGRADLRVSNDRHYYIRNGQEQLWRMGPTPTLYADTDGWKRLSIWGMGIASRDITGDGRPELLLTSMGDQKFRVPDPNASGPAYRDEAYERGLTAHMPYTGDEGRPSSGWHAGFGDVDNDGLDDLFIAKGNVEQMPDAAMRDPNNLLMQQLDGRFAEAGLDAGIASPARGRGAALADLNRDGRLDIVVVNRRDNFELYENVTPSTGHWLAVDTRQPGPNRRAVGAWIEVSDGSKTWHREITVGGGHAGGYAGPQHFGLGGAQTVEVRVMWPDGSRSEWLTSDVDRTVRIDREKGLSDID